MQTIQAIKWSQWDGAGRHNFKAYLSAEKNYIETLRLGYEYDNFELVNLVIYDDTLDFNKNQAIEIKRRLWDKMTAIEREVMGMMERP